jgi:NTP pyrophosphatase (non-canonical NTP hydrolase)
LAEGLRILKMTQREVGRAIPGWVEGEPEFIRTTFLALVCELMELLQLFNWKQWKRTVPFDASKAADEFADVLAFLGYVVLYLDQRGVGPDILARAYEDKTLTNKRRLAGKVEGYGVGRPWVDDSDPGAAMADAMGLPNAGKYRQGELFPTEAE